jgi:ubiquinone/menaquinone biosynthesis C-methylase UbiE
MNFQQIVERLKHCEIEGGVWIDAGCGNGTYTFPLATLVSQVIALDRNKNNLSYLESKISTQTNIITQQFDFHQPSWYEYLVDGIFFGFSLHYDPIHENALEHAYQQLKEGGKLVIIEYSSTKSVPWVPYPIPLQKLIPILKDLSYDNIKVIQKNPPRRISIHWDNASYMITALK